MKALLMCGVVLAMVCAEPIFSTGQTLGVRYAVCARLKFVRGVKSLKCSKPVPLDGSDPERRHSLSWHGQRFQYAG